tara:strand:- start:287 stop:505 length:219 start_codon:yes stop_codon:yes gene_type:complete
MVALDSLVSNEELNLEVVIYRLVEPSDISSESTLDNAPGTIFPLELMTSDDPTDNPYSITNVCVVAIACVLL